VDPARGVARLEAAAGVRFPHITAAREETERRLAERSQQLATLAVDPGAAVVLTGSWGRREVTSESDDDFIVLFSRDPEADARPTAESVAAALDSRSPGLEGIFHEQVSLESLAGRIGRDEDSNANLTRRMLLILESVPVLGAGVHASARRTLLDGYLSAGGKDYRPPRFLLNDLVRYWRTIAVDFESKMRQRRGDGWGLRNAKLRLSRKNLFAGGLLPVLECYRFPATEMLDHLDERMAVPPLDRLADAFVDHGAIDPGVRALRAYDEFLAILDDHEKRAELQELTRTDRNESAVFARVSDLGNEFEAGLLALLFDDPELRRWVREYLIF
jgi:Putative nucleotidyltransferase DUF294